MIPVGTTFTNLPAEWADLDEAAWEIRMRFRDSGEANYVAERLRRNGAPVISDGFRRIMVGVEDESAARRKTAELQLLAGRATFTVRPLSRFRRWLLRQGMVGNYADAAAEGWQQRRTRELNDEEGVYRD